MKDILSGPGRRVLEEFAGSNVLLAFDFDGTLAPLVAVPERARMRETTTRLLGELTSLYPSVIISGRSQADVLERLGGVPVHGVVGNHGAESRESSEQPPEEVKRWRPLLEKALTPFPGVRVEDKGFSISVHYRQSREKRRAQAAIRKAAAALGDVRVTGGRQVVNLLPKGAPHKGIALERERERLACDTAIYVGDDDTDEDVFALGQPARLLTIRIGAKPVSGASYYIQSQADIDELLRVLVHLRRRSDRPQRMPAR